MTAAALVADLAGDPHRAGVKVDVLWSKGGEFGPAEAGEGGQQDERTVSRPNGICQGVDLRHSQDRTLRRTLLASTLDPARIATDQPVFQRRVEDRPEKPVGLGCRYFADL
jgi:hypothetical protein